MNRFKVVLVAAAASAGFCGAAYATEIDNTALAAPGVYFGSGNANSNFTVDSQGNLEIGLSAIERFVGPIVPVGNIYTVPLGPTSVPTKTGANWGFDFSVNLNALGTGTAHLSDITTSLTLVDVAKGTTGSFDPLALIPDNSQFGPGGKQDCNVSCDPTTNYAFQNSEALSFFGIAFLFNDLGFDMNLDDTYFLTLQVFDADHTQLGSDTIQINAGNGASVPEPLTLSLFGAGLCGAAVLRRRKNRKS